MRGYPVFRVPTPSQKKHKIDGHDTSNTLAQFPANMAKGDKGGSSSALPKIAGKGCERKTDKPMIDAHKSYFSKRLPLDDELCFFKGGEERVQGLSGIPF
jgi:hypothetical protein